MTEMGKKRRWRREIGVERMEDGKKQ